MTGPEDRAGEPGSAPGRFDGHRRLHGHDAAQGVDTAGVPWAGREVTGSPFAGDTGEPDAAVRAALAAIAGAADPAPADPATGEPATLLAAEIDLLAALRSARLFAAIEAVAADVQPGAAGELTREVVSDMAMPVLTAPDGRRAMPLFTGLDTLARWRDQARPVPVGTLDAAQAAVQDECDVLLLDLGSGPDGAPAHVLRLSQLWALAQGRSWQPAHDDPVVQAGLERAVSGRPDILGADLADGSARAPGLTRVILTLRAGLPQQAVRELAAEVAEALAGDPEVRIRVDNLAMELRSA